MRSLIAALTGVIAMSTIAQAEIQPIFQKDTGLWIGISQGSKIIKAKAAVRPDVRINTSMGWSLDGKGSHNATITRNGNTWVVTREEGDWQISSNLTVDADEIKRYATITYKGTKPLQLWGVSLYTPELSLANDAKQYALIPGEYPVQPMLQGSWQSGRDRMEIGWTRAEYNVAFLHSPKAKLSLICGYKFIEDQARVGVHEGDKAVSLFHQFDASKHMKTGDSITVGEQRIRLVSGPADVIMNATMSLVNSLDHGPAANPPSWLYGGTVMELHPWGPLEIWMAGDNGQRYDRLQRQMPYYKALGVNILWHLPTQTTPPWVYTTMGQGLVHEANGTKQQLKDMIAAGHKIGVKSIADLVVYGMHPDAPDAKTLPDEVWCRNPKGDIDLVWGGSIKPADASSIPWQQYIKKASHNWAAEYGFDGARLDVGGWGQIHNWNNPDRANAAMAKGGIELNKAVRDGFREVIPDAMILPEIGKPIAFKQSDLQFDYPFYLVMRDLLTTSDIPTWINNAKLWLDWQRATNPTAAMHAWGRFTDNHDTVAPDCFFGAGINQALLAISCLMEGTPILYQDQETGFSEELALWLALRSKWDCFSHGSAKYTSVKSSDPRVFSFLRVGPTSAAVVAVNLSNETIKTRVTIPGDMLSKYPFSASALPGCSVKVVKPGTAAITVPAYRPAVVLLTSKAVVIPAIAKIQPRQVDALQNGYNPETGELVVANATHWTMQTPEGDLREKFWDWGMDLSKTNDPLKSLPVLKRVWSPLETGILDGSRRAVIGLQTADNKLISAAFDPSKATEVRIEDDGLDGKQVKLIIRPASAMLPLKSPALKPIPEMNVSATHLNMAIGKSSVQAVRRQGGIPMNITVAGQPINAQASMAYTDYGFYKKGEMVSINGETNPRLFTEESDGRKIARFIGLMHGQSWNGVQTCGVASPELQYELEYELRANGEVAITFSVIATQDIAEGSAFAGLNIPLNGATLAVQGSDAIGQGRNAMLKAPGSIKLRGVSAPYEVSWSKGNGAVFTIGQGQQASNLYICPVDGPLPAMKKGDKLSQQAVIR